MWVPRFSLEKRAYSKSRPHASATCLRQAGQKRGTRLDIIDEAIGETEKQLC